MSRDAWITLIIGLAVLITAAGMLRKVRLRSRIRPTHEPQGVRMATSRRIELTTSDARSLGGAGATLVAAMWIAFGLPDLGQAAASAWGSAVTILVGAWLGTRQEPAAASAAASTTATAAANLVRANPDADPEHLAAAIEVMGTRRDGA